MQKTESVTDVFRTKQIALLNDLARTAMGIASRLVQTEGINHLALEDQSRIRELVETFDAFTEDNDPYGEHDFGSFDYQCSRGPERTVKVFWKIDYYAKDLNGGSEHPEDPRQTTRVLTIMLAEEY